tara:strand:+ start:1987 stop:2106 length:120 start_codon:yes stop_codon:yes gene_type:complete
MSVLEKNAKDDGSKDGKSNNARPPRGSIERLQVVVGHLE